MQSIKNKYYRYIKDKVAILEACKALGIPEKHAGTVHVCKCPHHADEHPSLTIYEDTNSYYCFQCGDSGDVFRFVMAQRDCDFQDALKWIEHTFPEVHAHMPVSADIMSESSSANGYDIAWQIYQQMTDDEQSAFNKYAKERGYNPEHLYNRELVFATGRKLSDKFKQEEFIEERYLLEEKSLLTKVPRDVINRVALTDRYNDYYATDRIIVPLRNLSGGLVGFAGRSVSEKDKPKYLFTKGLKKGDFLYRLCDVVKSRRKASSTKLYLVEGIFDALRLETKKQSAVAVLGSHLTEKQTKVLERCVEDGGLSISSICVFMDSDEAGINGNFKTLKNLIKSSVLRKCSISVMVLLNGVKDPDGYYAKHSITNTEGIKEYSIFEYLFRYYLYNEECSLTELDIEKEFQQKSSEERIYILNQIQNLLPYEDWKEVFARIHAIGVEGKDDNVLQDRIENYVFANSNSSSITYEESVEFNYHMQSALQIARTSYDREEITLDDWTWERIAAATDVFFPLFYNVLRERDKAVKLPLIRLMVPKKLGEQRAKSMYIHEQLLMQQYVMNELLSTGCDIKYEKYIPAVRYSTVRKSYVTGLNYYQFFEEPVSFAYQIDMDVINGVRQANSGMFRNFYDCWKDYIYYIQEGVSRLDGDTVYRVKLDISGFYDHISKGLVRDVLQPQLTEALRVDNNKFECFQGSGDGCNEVARETVEWILEQLFEEHYYQPDTGVEDKKVDTNIGIPQGPNLSAYIANIALFPLDKIVQERVNQINGKPEENTNQIKVRYCRYVDDMVIVSSSPEYLLQLKDIIESTIYDLGFELSPKTDQEDGVSKEEAIQWTVDERGGLGVSVGFDFPDDSMDSIMDEYVDLERTDRRTLLKLLKSILNIALYEGVPSEEIEFDSLLKIVFQTEEIRLNDIVRFSELMLCEAAKKENIFVSFKEIWEQGLNNCVSDSLLLTEGLDSYVFLQGCERALKRLTKTQVGDCGEIWRSTQSKIENFFGNAVNRKEVLNLIDTVDLLKCNKHMMLLQFTKIDILLGKQNDNMLDDTIGYFARWNWYHKHVSGEIIDEIPKGSNYVQWFHWMLIRLSSATNKNDISNVFSSVRNNFMAKIGSVDKNILMLCMEIWTADKSAEIQEIDQENIRASLFTLLNVLPQELRAETVREIEIYKNLLFDSTQDVLSVFPGVNSPGIMALEKGETDSPFVVGAKRYDFYETDDEIIDKPLKWTKLSTDNSSYNEKIYIQPYERTFDLNTCHISLGEYVNGLNLCSPKNVLEAILLLYPNIYPAVCTANKLYPDRHMILSRENVILLLEKDKKTIKDVELGITYLISKNLVANGVAIRQNDGSYVLKTVNKEGAAYWITGKLLEDACEIAKYLLERNCSETTYDEEDLEMLSYVTRRLTGSHKGSYAQIHRSDLSYKKSVDRILKKLSEYLKQSTVKSFYLEDAKIVNSLISYRMSSSMAMPDDWSLAVWSKNYLCTHYKRLIEISREVSSEDCEIDVKLKRRVSAWYLALGNRLFWIYNNNRLLIGIKTLASSLLSDAVLMNLRMQVLEFIQLLDNQTRERYRKEYTELPLASLGLEEDVEITKRNKSWKTIWNNLLQNVQDNDIKYLTHIGWIAFMAMLMEVDKPGPIISGITKASWENAIEALMEVVTALDSIVDTKQSEEEFPFEGMQAFYDIWTLQNVEKMAACMNRLDEALEFEIDLVDSRFFEMRTARRDILVRLEAEEYCRPLCFVTYSKKINNGLDSFERNPNNEKEIRLTSTKKGKKLLGISIISKEFGETLYSWEHPGPLCIFDNTVEKTEIEEVELRESLQNAKNDSIRMHEELLHIEDSDKQSIVLNEEKEQGRNHDSEEKHDTGDIESTISNIHSKNWKKRPKAFEQLDRIALFQFRIDSSYLPPEMEVENNGRDDTYLPSYAEYRRRELLRPVLNACNEFGVEILLLPEYSIRPETVVWMCKYLEEKRYTFSIWAGTFKIPAGYHFEEDYWKIPEKEVLNSDIYCHSAPLPIIMNDLEQPDGGVCIVAKKVKKYPAVALKEEINPVPAINQMMAQDSFRPIVDRVRKNKGINVDADARKDVTELICAETFAVSNITNYPSFLQASMEAYYKYAKNNSAKPIDKFKRIMIEDIMQFGSSTAIFSLEERKHRSSIVLIPACSSRAVDYYVIGQGNYLAAGLKMVFCNSVDASARGGSCFIGQNSWDDAKLRRGDGEKDRQKQDILTENTYYHGLCPGIYQQSSEYRDRGALGKAEQALLICDVLPNEQNKPTAESLMSSLTVVAHIPIFEVDSTKNIAKTEEAIKRLLNHCTKDYSMTIEDIEAKNMQDDLRVLGKEYHSDWLVERGIFYQKYHKTKPQSWPPPALIDWMYVKLMSRAEFQEADDEEKKRYMIQVP